MTESATETSNEDAVIVQRLSENEDRNSYMQNSENWAGKSFKS
jgi:hypothetical protein